MLVENQKLTHEPILLPYCLTVFRLFYIRFSTKSGSNMEHGCNFASCEAYVKVSVNFSPYFLCLRQESVKRCKLSLGIAYRSFCPSKRLRFDMVHNQKYMM